MKEERSNIDQTCLDIEKLVEDPRSKEKKYKEGVLQHNLVILTLYAHLAARAAFTESALAPPSRSRGFSRVLSLQQNLEEF